ncbi:MAG: hypothetical protein ACHQQS_08100 [Thermoanaerobaculales bacterium]
MRRGLFLLLILLTFSAGCFEPRRERPRDRVTRIRLGYRVSANWREMEKANDGRPMLVMELNVTNSGKETLPQVTMVLHVRDFDGKERERRPLTLDTSQIGPNATRTVTVRMPGVEPREGEEVSLEMEGQPNPAEMKAYPEYRGVS